MRSKRFIAAITALCIAGGTMPAVCCFSPAAVLTASAENENSADAPVKLFFLDSSYSSILSIPESCPQSYQITLDGSYENVRYSCSSSVVKVDENGLVTPKTTSTYVIGGGGMQELYNEGTGVVTVIADNERFEYNFEIVSYARYYAEDKANTYLEKNITDDMTDREKIETICKFVSSYDYSAYHSGMISMIATGEGGDCWASTSTVNYMCQKLGFKARTRDASGDSGAGSGHRNSVVEDSKGKIYMVDCGYSGSAPRTYSIKEYDSPFVCTTRANGTLEIKEYFGFDTEITVPSEIDGVAVTSIGKQVFYTANRYLPEEITSVTLPDTINNIGISAFYDMDSLTELYIPASVGNIEMSAFGDCDNLDLQIDPANKYYTIKDGILFSKDMKHLVAAINFTEKNYSGNGGYTYVKKDYTVPDGVEYIDDNAFYRCGSLTGVTFPDSLKHIGYCAFYDCSIRKPVILPESLTGVGYGAFANSGASCIIFKGSDYVINDTKENNLCDDEDGSTLRGFTPTILIAPKGSAAEEYAEKFATGQSTVYSSDGTTETKTFIRYKYGEYKEEGDSAIDSGKTDEFTWDLTWNSKLGVSLRFSGTSEINNLSSDDLCYTNSVNTLIIDDSISYIADDVLSQFSSATTIAGTSGSYAERTAFKLGYNFVDLDAADEPENYLAGDANVDGNVNMADAVLIMQVNADPAAYKLTDQGRKNADVYGGGDGVTNNDALAIQQFEAGIVTVLPVTK